MVAAPQPLPDLPHHVPLLQLDQLSLDGRPVPGGEPERASEREFDMMSTSG